MATTILPYKNLGEKLAVNLDLSQIPHRAIGDYSILVDKSAVGSSLSLDVDAQVPSAITEAFPKSERARPPLELVATVVSIDAGIREPVTLKQQKPNLYKGTINLDVDRIPEAVRICVYAVRTKPGSGGGFAPRKGCRLAWGPTHEIRFTERPVKGKFLNVKWEDFGNSSVVPAGFEKAMYYVDAEADPPVLYLNKLASAPLVTLLRTEGHGHPKAMSRDLLFRAIANDVWFVLAQAALDSLRKEAATGTPVDLNAAFDGSWKQEIIELLAPIVLPGLQAEDAVAEFCNRMDDDTYYADTLLRAEVAIQTDQSLRDQFEKFAEREYEHG
jgi:hypothetical protein